MRALSRRRALGAGAALLAAPAPGAAASAQGALRRILEDGELRLGAHLGDPPWAAHDERGRPDGAEIALARQLAEDLAVRLRVVPLPAGGEVRALELGQVDVVASLPLRPGLLRHVALAHPHARRRSVIAGGAGRRLRGFADLAGLDVALPAGGGLGGAVHGRLPPDAVTLFLPDAAECLAALLAGEVQAAAAHAWSVEAILLADPGAPIEPGFLVEDVPLSLAVALGERDLLRFLDTFLRLRIADGTLDALRRPFFVSAPPEETGAP